MTNTKFRKRALLSSIAMLLVALVALGSATFAWFVANPTVTATGLKMQATAAPGLKIASESDAVKKAALANHAKTTNDYTFASTANLASGDFDILPASPVLSYSTDLNLPFYDIKATADNVKTADTTNDTFHTITPMTIVDYTAAIAEPATPESWDTTEGGAKVYYEDLYFQKSGSGSGDVTIQAVGVKITLNTTDNADIPKGIKVALVAKKPGTTTTYQVLGVWKADGGDSTDYYSGTSTTMTSGYTYTASGGSVKNLSITVNDSAAGSGAQIRAYVYLDGENTYTTSSRAQSLTQLVNSIDIRVSTANEDINFNA